jgi:hypothetical protein
MKHIQIFEDFKPVPKSGPSFFGKMAQGVKHALGFEKAEDRKTLDSLYRAFDSTHEYGWVKNVREIKPGVIVAWVNDNAITVDKNAPEIRYKGRTLDLHNIQDEVDSIYDKLLSIQKSDNNIK